MTRIITLANQKGGVGKTTTTLNLGAALAGRGRQVLLVDLDPQSNLTACLDVKQNEVVPTSYQVLYYPERGADCAVRAARERVDLIPATLDMAAAEVELAGKIERELLLREALAPLQLDISLECKRSGDVRAWIGRRGPIAWCADVFDGSQDQGHCRRR